MINPNSRIVILKSKPKYEKDSVEKFNKICDKLQEKFKGKGK